MSSGVEEVIERAAEEHITFGKLLRRPRPGHAMSAVHRIVSLPLPLSRKIEEVRRIDADGPGGSAQPPRQRAGRQVSAVKRRIARRSFLAFLLTDFLKVARFGRRTYVLEALWLPPRLRMARHLPAFFSTDLRATATALSAQLAPIAAQGWHWLTPRQYNLVVLLKLLADRVRPMDLPEPGYRQGDVDLRRIEIPFLLLHYDAASLPDLFGALRTWYGRRGEQEEQEKTMRLTLQLIADDCTLPSLFNCILGFNMLRARRFLTLRDLMSAGLGDVIDPSRFDFERRTHEAVQEQIRATRESMSLLHRQLEEARRTNSFITRDERGNPDARDVAAVYETVSEEGPPARFLEDQENLPVFVARLARGFDAAFGSFLGAASHLEPGGQVRVFPPGLFSPALAALRNTVSLLEQEGRQFFRFPLPRYQAVRSGALTAIGEEKRLAALISQAVGTLVDIGRVTTGISVSSLPHADSTLVGVPAVGKLTVKAALRTVASVCFGAGLLLRDEFLVMSLGREKKLAVALDQKMKYLQRFVDPATYKDLAAKYA